MARAAHPDARPHFPDDVNAAPPPRPSRALDRLLACCGVVDRITESMSRVAAGAVLAACLISAGNALVRYGWNLSSNGWLEIQWYLFAVTVMLGAPQVLRRNEHVAWISSTRA